MDKVRRWLNQEDFMSIPHPDPTANLNLEVAIRREDPRRLTVWFPKGHEDAIEIISGIHFTPEQKSRFLVKGEQKVREFVSDLRMRLLSLNIGFDIRPESDHILKVWRIVYLDGMTKNLFFETLALVFEGVMMGQWSLESYFGDPSFFRNEPMQAYHEPMYRWGG